MIKWTKTIVWLTVKRLEFYTKTDVITRNPAANWSCSETRDEKLQIKIEILIKLSVLMISVAWFIFKFLLNNHHCVNLRTINQKWLCPSMSPMLQIQQQVRALWLHHHQLLCHHQHRRRRRHQARCRKHRNRKIQAVVPPHNIRPCFRQ